MDTPIGQQLFEATHPSVRFVALDDESRKWWAWLETDLKVKWNRPPQPVDGKRHETLTGEWLYGQLMKYLHDGPDNIPFGVVGPNTRDAYEAVTQDILAMVDANPWIPCSKRLPIEADAVNGLVEYTYDGRCDSPDWRSYDLVKKEKVSAWWRHIIMPEGSAFEQWHESIKDYLGTVPGKRLLQQAFEAGAKSTTK